MSTARTSLARTVAILCASPGFQRFLAERFPQAWAETGDFRDPERAAMVVRKSCSISSRSQLNSDRAAAQRYHACIGLPYSSWRGVRPNPPDGASRCVPKSRDSLCRADT